MEDITKILIVDDNADNLDMMEFLLINNNYRVKSATNGKEALEILYNEEFDLIISDILMPIMDGFQLCKECKKDKRLKEICFVFYTATYIDSKDEEFALSLGAQKFIRKPQEPEIFLKIINETLDDFRKTEKESFNTQEKDEKEILKLYSERLVAKLEKKNLDLEQEIKRHKQTLEQLEKAKKKAEESDRLKTAFLSNMSHELRTPMNGIIGFTNLLKNPDLTSKEQQKYINVVQMSTNRLLNLITDLINISQIETGQMPVKVTEFSVRQIIEQIYSYFITATDKKGLNFIVSCSSIEYDTVIKTDQEKFETILANLIKNAIKYTTEGTIELICNQTEDSFEFIVKDTGIGIPEDRIKAVFDRFVQADINDSMAMEGAGLGLTIAKEYTKMLGGKIHVESEKEKGSTFYITFPISLKADIKEDMIPEDENAAINTPKKLKVLIAEDDHSSDLYLTAILEEVSSEIMHAKTGAEAVEICSENKDIDLILMDIKMPEMTGFTAIEKIREFNKDAIIIAQTAYAMAGDKEKLINIGCNDYIAKPIDMDELNKMINKHLY